MIKFDEDIIKKIDNSKFLRKKTLLLESIGACSLAYGVANPEYFFLSAVAFAGTIYSIKTFYDDELDDVRWKKLLNYNKEDYNFLDEMCNEYIYHISRILKNYEFNDKLVLCYALNSLLNDSMFSLNEFTYTKPKNTFGEINKIASSYVIDGKSCCRHNTDFMAKLFTKLDIPNFKIYVSTNFFRPNKYNHILNAVVDRGRILPFDFTGGMPLNINLKRYDLMAESPFEDEFYPFYYKIGGFKEFYKVDDIYKLDTSDITDEEMLYARYIGEDLARIIKKDMLSNPFHGYMEGLKKQISEKSLKLVPRR